MYLPMGMHPAANSFLRADQLDGQESLFELQTHVCLQCGLAQIADQIPPGFFTHYLYIPSASATMQEHFASFANRLRDKYLTRADALLVDIGCNDGLFLNAAHQMGIRTLGIDPAANIAELARQKGLTVVTEYFGPETARNVRERFGGASAIVTTNTLNHVDDLHGFMAGVQTLLAPDGVFVLEVPQALHFIERNEFDTIYHEHLSVFSVKSLVELYRFSGMEIVDIEELDVHGGSMRVYARRANTGGPASPAAEEWRHREPPAGIFSASAYEVAGGAGEAIRNNLLALLARLRGEGKMIAGYGAPAKGNTLLNYCQIGQDTLAYLVDKNPLKQGLYSPGMHIPIMGLDALSQRPPDYLLILAWNFASEIMEQQESFRRAGGKFILPIPEPAVVE